MTLEEIANKIKNAKKFAVVTHVNPDCDAFGSMFSMYEILNQLGKDCDMFVDGKLSEAQSNLFEVEKICEDAFNAKKYDLVFAVDANARYRLGKYVNDFHNAKYSLLIDHHTGDDLFTNDGYIDNQSSSTCEILCELFKVLKVKMNPKIATYLYAGIATDTNSFMNPNVRANTYKVSEKLFKSGANVALINKLCFRSTTKNGLALTKIFYQKQKFAIDGKLAYVVLTDRDFKNSCSSYLDAESFSTLLDSVVGVNLAVCATEREKGIYKLSIRSNNSGKDYALQLATQLGGGGHKQAAGATIKTHSENKVEKTIVKTAEKILER